MNALISIAGPGYFVAVAAVLVAALIAKAGAARAPNEEPQRRGWLMLMLASASALTPGVLVLYGYAVAADTMQRILLMGLPLVASFLGSFTGALIGLVTRDARVMFRMASIVAGFGALIVALGVAAPRLDPAWLISAASALTH
jgi:hypothetical protein